jgi:group I intron endonuclease
MNKEFTSSRKRLKNKISKANLGKTGYANLGKPRSEETKLKISKGQLGRTHSEETKLKMVGNKGQITRVTDLTTNEVTEFVSLRKAAEYLGTSLDTVRRYVKDNKNFKNRYKIESKVKTKM